ncbi:BTAD domain-containing putative transcriptional regulator [Actinomadura vinacea]|uniref:BTAD domain-containing putative transcriptional regulator n=1 Tax=Actinomadura vinacea TaxID=115336 RepID=A0ABN3JPN3_9ACTN
MRVGILGPLEVTAGDGTVVRIGGARLRALLIRLALDAGRVVTVDALCHALWPSAEDGPDNPPHALHSLVARLRRALPDGSALLSLPAGYRLDLPSEAVDARRFETLAHEGRQALRGGRPGEALTLLTAALELWRGEALADAAPRHPFAANAAVRLDELRLNVQEDRLDAALNGGTAPSALIAELDGLTTAHPYRERLRHLRIRALFADGRQPEALTAYDEYRRFLADELGTDPGPELQNLYLTVLGNKRPASGNVRAPLTSFVGRERERARLRGLLAGNRLVTLVGPGGVGKTRLATTVAAGAWLVELAPVTDPDEVPYAVAAALDLHEPGRSADVVQRLAESLSPAETLIILDNCEHVIDAAARLAHELLGRCPDLTILATSREPLAMAGETLCPVPPLDDDQASRLFVDRAGAASPGFASGPHVPAICRRLDNLPLAIELAAARLRSMPLEHLAARLDDRFRLLTGGNRTALPRHRTLRGVVAWSWDLLTAAERDAAERLAVFPATFSPSSAQHVGIALETLDALVDKSLLQLDGTRYRMLDTIREYGLERLAETDRFGASQDAFVSCFLTLAELAEPHLRGPEQLVWLNRLDAERDNLLAALHRACDSGDTDSAVRLGAALSLYWTIHGDHTEATNRLRTVLEMPGTSSRRLTALAGFLFNASFAGELAQAKDFPDAPPLDDPTGAHVQALKALSTGDIQGGVQALDPHLAHADPWTRAMTWLIRSFLHGAQTGTAAQGRQDLRNAVTAFRESRDRWGLSISLASAAFAHSATGDFDAAAAALEESTELIRELGADNQQQIWLAMIRVHSGDLDKAQAELQDVLADTTSPHQIALARVLLADLARHRGDLEEAARELALAAPETTDPPSRALYLAAQGHLATTTGDLTAAEKSFQEALAIAAIMPDMPMVAEVAVGQARLLLRQDHPCQAAEILGAAHALRGGPDTRHPDVHNLTEALKARLGTPAYESAYEQGRTHQAAFKLIVSSGAGEFVGGVRQLRGERDLS